MAVLNLFTRLDIVDRVGCVECDARQGEPCHSRFLDKPMVNEVHRTRRADAAKVQPARGRKWDPTNGGARREGGQT